MGTKFLSKLIFTGILSLFGTSLGLEIPNEQNRAKPNIIFIVADDLGFDDVSFRGSNEFLTPNIDALAYHGRILDRFYAPAVCSPSRAALLTGLYPIHTGTQFLTFLNGQSASLPSNLTVMSEVFQRAGYSTNLIGKWNLGMDLKEHTPTYRGFDTHYGYWGSYIDHFTRRSKFFCNQSIGYDFRRNLDLDCKNLGTYVTDLFTNEAERIIEENSTTGKPLFLMITHAAPHDPLQAPAEEIRKFSYIQDPQRRIYAAMVSILDRSVGRVIRSLERANLLENSIIIFSSDNGGASAGSPKNAARNWPLKGQKDTPWEGGLRLAAAIWSPLLGAARQSIFQDSIYIGDWLPTLAAAAEIQLPKETKLDGLDLWSKLRGNNDTGNSREGAKEQRSILHYSDPIRNVTALSRGPWKYIKGTTFNGIFDNVLTYREHDEVDPRAQRYVTEVRNSPASKALSKFDAQRLTQNRIENLRRGSFVHCGEMQRGCNALVEDCLYNIDLDPCEENNLLYDTKFADILSSMREEVRKLQESSLPVKGLHGICSKRAQSDPELHGCIWSNFLEEPASVRRECSMEGPPCGNL